MQKRWSCVFFSLFITKFQGIKNTNWFCSHLWNLATKGRGNRIEMQKVFAHFSLSLTHSLALADIRAILRSRSHSYAHGHTHTRTANSPFRRDIRHLFLLPFLSSVSLSLSLSFSISISISIYLFLFLHILRYYT